MKLDDAALRAAYQDGTRRGRRDDCPDSETLARGASGDLASAGREALVSHLATCSDCSVELQLARTLLPQKAAPAGTQRMWTFAIRIAAAVLVAAGVAVVMQSPSRSGAVRGGAPSGERTVPPDGAQLPEPPDALEWTSAPPAENFEIVVFDAESTEIWRSAPAVSAKAALPGEMRSGLRRGSPVYWRVLAVQGVERSTSPLFRFEIAPAR